MTMPDLLQLPGWAWWALANAAGFVAYIAYVVSKLDPDLTPRWRAAIVAAATLAALALGILVVLAMLSLEKFTSDPKDTPEVLP